MEKLNKIGLEVLQYKQELSKEEHSEIVRKALMSATTDLLSGEIITIDIHDALRDEETSEADVRQLVLEAPNLVKTEHELWGEYELIRVPFEERIKERKRLDDSSFARVSTESHVPLEEIQVIVSFEMSKEFIGEYFGREGELLERMMREDGFAEKFAILRYGALTSKFLQSLEGYDDERKRAVLFDDVDVGATKVYVNKDEELYGVELVFHIHVEKLEGGEETEELIAVIEDTIRNANEFMNIRTIA